MNNQEPLMPPESRSDQKALIAVTPEVPLALVKELRPGNHLTVTTMVQNTAGTDLLYFITVEWGSSENIVKRSALVLANLLLVTIRSDWEAENSAVLYQGSLSNLKRQPAQGRSLTAAKGSEPLEFDFYLPERTSNLALGLDLEAGFRFEAEAGAAGEWAHCSN